MSIQSGIRTYSKFNMMHFCSLFMKLNEPGFSLGSPGFCNHNISNHFKGKLYEYTK